MFSCLDNEMARLELGWAGARLGKLVVDGGLGTHQLLERSGLGIPRCGRALLCVPQGGRGRRGLLRELQGREDPCWRKEEQIEAAEGVATTPIMASVVGGDPGGTRAAGAAGGAARCRGARLANHIVPTAQVGHDDL